jgi:hypothetical protein
MSSETTTTAPSDQLRFVVTPRIRKALALATAQMDKKASATKETREALHKLHKDKSASEVPLGLLRQLSRVLLQIKASSNDGSDQKSRAAVVEYAHLHELLQGSQPVVARPPPPPKKVPHRPSFLPLFIFIYLRLLVLRQTPEQEALFNRLQIELDNKRYAKHVFLLFIYLSSCIRPTAWVVQSRSLSLLCSWVSLTAW